MSSPAPSSSSSASSGTIKPSFDLFEDLWLQLKECHKNALHELEAKVVKLKKDRCLDAQRLEEFYGRSQQLKEVQKGLQDTIAKLEGRLLLTAVCARCAPLEEQVRKRQTELEKQRQQNERLIAEHKNEKDSLQDENRKLSKELDRLKSSEAQEETPQCSEQEDGMIPDSPLHASAVPAVNKLKRRKTTDGQTKHVRYKEKPLPPLHTSLFGELNKESLEMLQGAGEVLVPDTCQMDMTQTSQGPGLDDVLVVAETCRLDVPKVLNKEEQGSSTPQQYKVPSRSSFRTRQGPGFSVLHPDDTGASPSLLPPGVLHKAKRRKQDLVQEVVMEKRKKNTTIIAAVSLQNNAAREERVTTTSHVCKQEPSAAHKVLSVQNGAPPGAQKPDVSFLSPADKTKRKSDEGRTRSVLRDLNAPLASAEEHERKAEVDQTWSIDPAAALSQYHTGSPDSPEEDRPHNQTETVDADCTFISHSMLQGRGTHAQHTGDGSGHRHQKANDSLDEMFDTTVCGEYKSYHSLTHLDHDERCTDEEEQGEEEEVAENVQKEHDFAENPGDDAKENKAGHPTYAHVAVVRNKEERRKLKGSTCKECDTYYAHLPEEERQKKLSECSRHRFRYIPPSTPENFWEVGFPSTQTCVERGYIKEDNNPEPRMRRRQPFNALFSPKRKEEEDGLFSPKRS